jgi:hypothetical protein
MTRDEVVAALGPPQVDRREQMLGDRVLYYSDLAVTLSAETERVVFVAFEFGCRVVVEGIDVYGDPQAFEKLLRLDGEPYESVGCVILLKLGITLDGFDVSDTDDRVLGAFAPGLWDARRSEFNSFPLPRG